MPGRAANAQLLLEQGASARRARLSGAWQPIPARQVNGAAGRPLRRAEGDTARAVVILDSALTANGATLKPAPRHVYALLTAAECGWTPATWRADLAGSAIAAATLDTCRQPQRACRPGGAGARPGRRGGDAPGRSGCAAGRRGLDERLTHAPWLSRRVHYGQPWQLSHRRRTMVTGGPAVPTPPILNQFPIGLPRGPRHGSAPRESTAPRDHGELTRF
jgi:hypothetical protein